ncbi:MAG: hypothetical protein M0Q98_13260, partial [Pseudomonas sp.]|nr:hypothetical protein [Pseudomonas sp.]
LLRVCGRLQAQYYILIIGPQTGRGAYPEAVFKVLQARVIRAMLLSNIAIYAAAIRVKPFAL